LDAAGTLRQRGFSLSGRTLEERHGPASDVKQQCRTLPGAVFVGRFGAEDECLRPCERDGACFTLGVFYRQMERLRHEPQGERRVAPLGHAALLVRHRFPPGEELAVVARILGWLDLITVNREERDRLLAAHACFFGR
jgi:hypothetical protein